MKPTKDLKLSDLLDYFAAHAPSEQQPWFRPKMPTKRPEDRWTGDPNSDHPGVVFPDKEAAGSACGFEMFHNAAFDEQADYAREMKAQACIQWPYAWAVKQVGERRRLAMLPAAIDPMAPHHEREAAFLFLFRFTDAAGALCDAIDRAGLNDKVPGFDAFVKAMDAAQEKARPFIAWKQDSGHTSKRDPRYTGD